MLISLWIAVVFVLAALALGCWFLYRRSWRRSDQDEELRRHVNRNYD
jgi:hypothetical protein